MAGRQVTVSWGSGGCGEQRGDHDGGECGQRPGTWLGQQRPPTDQRKGAVDHSDDRSDGPRVDPVGSRPLQCRYSIQTG